MSARFDAFFDKLLSTGSAIYLGRHAGLMQFGRSDHNAVTIGPSRSGKTSGLLTPTAALHPGPVVVTSTSHDIIEDSIKARSRIADRFGGRVAVIDFSEQPAARFENYAWSISDGCDSWNCAVDRAATLISAGFNDDASNDDFWRYTAPPVLQGVLAGAALTGATDLELVESVRTGYFEEFDYAIRTHFAHPHPAWQAFEAMNNPEVMAEETRRSVTATLNANIFSGFSFEPVFGLPQFDVSSFVEGLGALYIVVPDNRADNMKVIVAALVGAIVREYRKARRDMGTLMLVLDEVANISPLKQLPAIIDDGLKHGVQVFAGLQNRAQTERWGSKAAVILDGCTHTAIFGGLNDAEFFKSICERAPIEGHHDFTVSVAPNLPTGRRYADDARLIRERQELETSLRDVVPVLKQASLKRLLITLSMRRTSEGIKNRLSGPTTEALYEELMQFTSTSQQTSRRSVLEPPDIQNPGPRKFLHIQRNTDPRFFDAAHWRDDDVLYPLLSAH